MFKRVFDNYPSKPAIVIAPLIMSIVLGHYYYTRYQDCSHHTDLRLQFYAMLKKNSSLSLSSLPARNWEQALVKTAYKPNEMARAPDCPFGWDWGDDYRNTLIQDDNLTMIIFVKSGKPVDYIELEKHKVEFEDLKDSYTPGNDQFVIVERQEGTVILKPDN